MTNSREFDVLVWGATGFTGKWVAKHLYDQYPQSELRWGIAGRSAEKMESVREFIGDSAGEVKGLLADSNDEESLRELVSSCKVIISTVGPYAYYGSLLVKVCAEQGTHYVDLTGEVPWMREMIDAHLETAQASGARIVHSCGFDSIPSDIGNFYIQAEAYKKYQNYLKSVRFAVLKMKGGVSGGTVHSGLNVMEQVMKDKNIRRIMLNPYSLNPDPSFKGPDKGEQRAAKYSAELGKWTAPFLMSAINARIVRRSNALMDFKYGEDFSYSETMVTGKGMRGSIAATSMASAFAAFGAIGLTSPGRKLLSMMLPSQGKGPKVDPENPGFYIIEFNGETAAGEKMKALVKGDADPGYGSTSKMLAESAVCLAQDDGEIEVAGGFWTPASAMGEPLLKRLQDKAGLSFEIVE